MTQLPEMAKAIINEALERANKIGSLLQPGYTPVQVQAEASVHIAQELTMIRGNLAALAYVIQEHADKTAAT